jgi:hypothetical protein
MPATSRVGCGYWGLKRRPVARRASTAAAALSRTSPELGGRAWEESRLGAKWSSAHRDANGVDGGAAGSSMLAQSKFFSAAAGDETLTRASSTVALVFN